jgi:predicted nucleic acid-binding protein
VSWYLWDTDHLSALRVWPADLEISVEFGKLATDLRAAGRALTALDHLIAAIARRHDLTLFTADDDFTSVPALRVENWLV